MNCKKTEGFTYTEVIMTLPVVLLSILAAIGTLLGSMQYNDLAQAKTKAMNLAIYRIEEIKSKATTDTLNFQTVMTAYHNVRYPSAPPTQEQINILYGLGITVPTDIEAISTVTKIEEDLMDVTVTVFYRSKNGRMVGEDKNLNNVLDAGEDSNNNGALDSPIILKTMVARK